MNFRVIVGKCLHAVDRLLDIPFLTEVALRYVAPKSVRQRLFLRGIGDWRRGVGPFRSPEDVTSFLEVDRLLKEYWRIE